jgi:hypothetical protein
MVGIESVALPSATSRKDRIHPAASVLIRQRIAAVVVSGSSYLVNCIKFDTPISLQKTEKLAWHSKQILAEWKAAKKKKSITPSPTNIAVVSAVYTAIASPTAAPTILYPQELTTCMFTLLVCQRNTALLPIGNIEIDRNASVSP